MDKPSSSSLITPDDLILVTGAAGFIGSRVVENLLTRGFRNLRCLARTPSTAARLENLSARFPGARVEVIEGNLLSPTDCALVTRDVAVVYHLAAGRGEKSFADAFMNSVVTTRNLLDALVAGRSINRFVTVSSFSVYANNGGSRFLDESGAIEARPELRGDAYSFAKVKQDQLVAEYGNKFALPYVIVRPGVVYGPGNETITGRVGLGTFGIFLHLGGSNRIPLTYVDNCADAIVLAGITQGIEGETFNVVDDDLPTSRQFLRLYKKNVKRFRSIYVPRFVSYWLCFLWEKYSEWSEGQLPPAFNRRVWRAYWKKTSYSNQKLKAKLGWSPKIPFPEGLSAFFEACRKRGAHA